MLYYNIYIYVYIYIYILYVHISSGISALAPALQLSPPLINSANSFKIWASMASFLEGYPAEELKTTTIVQSQLGMQ